MERGRGRHDEVIPPSDEGGGVSRVTSEPAELRRETRNAAKYRRKSARAFFTIDDRTEYYFS